MDDKRIKIGIVGTGLIGYGWHLKACKKLSNLFEISAVCDINKQWGNKVAREYNTRYYDNVESLLRNDSIELIVVAVPGVFHKNISIKAMESGKHVIVEKPMALNDQEAEKMIAVAKKTKKKLFVHHNRRWDRDFVTLQNIFNKKILGRVYVIESKVSKYSLVRGLTTGKNIDWRLTKKFGGGRLNEWGSHLIDQMLLLVKSEPLWVSSDLQNRCFKKDAEDHVNIWIKFENGILGKIEISQSSRINLFPRWFVLGTNATLCGNFGNAEPGSSISNKTSSSSFEIKTGKVNELKTKFVPLVSTDMYGFYKNIYQCIIKNKEPIVKLEEVRKVIKVMDAIRKSNIKGQAVYL
ncbi:MAG: Gfo/Idh/MocA family oxidoreductase [Elusimicrobia bacterium]|nr:Gfo/Idh/MocA family oxidoreductase [Elusimicrobiota bacterium]